MLEESKHDANKLVWDTLSYEMITKDKWIESILQSMPINSHINPEEFAKQAWKIVEELWSERIYFKPAYDKNYKDDEQR